MELILIQNMNLFLILELIKGSEFLTKKGQLKIYKYNCVPQQYVDNLIEQKK